MTKQPLPKLLQPNLLDNQRRRADGSLVGTSARGRYNKPVDTVLVLDLVERTLTRLESDLTRTRATIEKIKAMLPQG